MASACFSVRSRWRGANHKAVGRPMDRAAPNSFRTDGDVKAGAEPSSCFAAPKKSPLLTLAFAARRTQGLNSLTVGQSFLRPRHPYVGLRRNRVRHHDEHMPLVTQSIEPTSRSLAQNATLVGQVSPPSRAAGYYHGENTSNILDVPNTDKFQTEAPQRFALSRAVSARARVAGAINLDEIHRSGRTSRFSFSRCTVPFNLT